MLKFSDGGKLEAMLEAKHLLEKELAEDNPEINKARKLIERKLKIKPLESPAAIIHKNIVRHAKKVTVFNQRGEKFDSLFGTLKIDYHPSED